MKIIMELYETDTRPEDMRVILQDGLYLVQSKSKVIDSWMTLIERKYEKDALMICCDWY